MEETSAFASIVHLCMMSFWDFWIIDARSPIIVRVDHDDRMEIAAQSGQLLDGALKRFDEFGLIPFEVHVNDNEP